MIYENGLMGLGIVEPLPQNVLDYKVPVPTGTTDTGGNWLDKLLNTVNKVAPTVKTGISVYDQIKNSGGSTTNPNPYQGSNTNVLPQPTTGMSTGAKVAIGVASAGVLTALVMAATGKKKKK